MALIPSLYYRISLWSTELLARYFQWRYLFLQFTCVFSFSTQNLYTYGQCCHHSMIRQKTAIWFFVDDTFTKWRNECDVVQKAYQFNFALENVIPCAYGWTCLKIVLYQFLYRGKHYICILVMQFGIFPPSLFSLFIYGLDHENLSPCLIIFSFLSC